MPLEHFRPFYPRGSETVICSSTDQSPDQTEHQQDESLLTSFTDQQVDFDSTRLSNSRVPHIEDAADGIIDGSRSIGDNQDMAGEDGRESGAEARIEAPPGSSCEENRLSDEDKTDDKEIENRISCPYKMRQELHVTYNVEHARYEGLPAAWRTLNVQFGLPLEAVPKRTVDGYDAKIPAVLQMLKDYLLARDGVGVEGIFRLAPDRDECARAKYEINNGAFTGCADVNVVANLIKVWFRELPRGIFNMVPEKHIYAVCELKDHERVIESVDAFPSLHRSLVLWLLDLMVEIVMNERVNKMSAKNMAIVMAPNLFTILSDNPMFALTMSQKVAEYTLALLSARLHHAQASMLPRTDV